QIEQHDGAHGVVVPGVARGGLVVPDVFAGVRTDGDDRRQEEGVAAGGVAVALVPWRAVAAAEEHQAVVLVVDHGVPDGAAAAHGPPLAAPGLRGHLHLRALEAHFRVAGHGVEAPQVLAGAGVVGADVAAHAELAARVADQYLALDDAG